MFLRFALRKKRGKREAAKPRFLVLRRRTLTVGAALLAAAAIFGAVNAPAAVRASAATRQLPIYCVERDQKVCSISFDAAWGADNTQKILDVLADYGVKCTFFVVGNWADQYPEQAKAIVESGNELMNHSNAHDHYNSLTADQIIADVNTCSDKIEALTGVRPTLIRCPFGEYDDHVISAIRSIGMEPIQWDVERYHIAYLRRIHPCTAEVQRVGGNGIPEREEQSDDLRPACKSEVQVRKPAFLVPRLLCGYGRT